MCEATRKTSETDGTMSSLSQTFSYDFENEAMMAKFRWLAQPEGQDHGWSQQDRLTSWASNSTTLNETQSWSLSLEGAWNSTTVNGNTENRTFNQTYETLFSNANPMSHDRKGNLTQNKDGSLYTWDFNNQLAFSTAGTPSVNAAYAYDALGRRVSKSSGNTITVFVHTNYQIATEYKSVNGGEFTENQSFVYATYIDDPIALISTNGTYFYHSNQQYSISAITDSNGNLSERYGYNAYGKPVIITDSILVDNPYFFTGRQLDSETGLFYFRARYYDASLGQFISRDPLNYVDGMNLYRGYFAINGVDFNGKKTWGVTTYNEAEPIIVKKESCFTVYTSRMGGAGNCCRQIRTFVFFDRTTFEVRQHYGYEEIDSGLENTQQILTGVAAVSSVVALYPPARPVAGAVAAISAFGAYVLSTMNETTNIQPPLPTTESFTTQYFQNTITNIQETYSYEEMPCSEIQVGQSTHCFEAIQ